LYILTSLFTSLHILYRKKHQSSVVAWIAIVWIAPFVGSLIYWVFGFNRIYRKKKSQRNLSIVSNQNQYIEKNTPKLEKLSRAVTQLPLTHSNRIDVLHSQQYAFTEMIKKVRHTKYTITLCTYIFKYDEVGKEFIKALKDAQKRGVEVRILIDSMGSRYSPRSILKIFKQNKLPYAVFLPTHLPWKVPSINLRNHRKILVLDGKQAFTGGMNISGSINPTAHTHRDIHFFVEGPVVEHIQKAFSEDWEFSAGEVLEGQYWFGNYVPAGNVSARGIFDGPDEDYNTMKTIFISAIGQAKKQIQIMTPYFLPDETVINALQIASKSGINVRIIVPKRNNIRFIQWASTVPLSDLRNIGCEIYLSQEPFDHSKLFLVDDDLFFIGSANWDDCSFKLNFEFNLQCYDKEIATELKSYIDTTVQRSEVLPKKYYDTNPGWVRLRDHLFYILKGYM